MEAAGPSAQHQNGCYFLDSAPAWVVGMGDQPRRESGSDEFTGQGMMVTASGLVLHFRTGAPGLRLCGTEGEIVFSFDDAWRWWQDAEIDDCNAPDPFPGYGGVVGLGQDADAV